MHSNHGIYSCEVRVARRRLSAGRLKHCEVATDGRRAVDKHGATSLIDDEHADRLVQDILRDQRDTKALTLRCEPLVDTGDMTSNLKAPTTNEPINT